MRRALLVVYEAIFAPMAFLMKQLDEAKVSERRRAIAERKLARWYIGAVLAGRYQSSTHDRQERDKKEVGAWIESDHGEEPQWLRETAIPSLKTADPNSALGRLIKSLLNATGLRDPVTLGDIGLGSGKKTSSVHHIFPTRFVQKLPGWKGEIDKSDLALNIMFLEEKTNSSWLHDDPRFQVEAAISARGSREQVYGVYASHAISKRAVELLLIPSKKREEFFEFISLREEAVISMLEEWGFQRALAAPSEEDAIALRD